jgi:hypothetical protein
MDRRDRRSPTLSTTTSRSSNRSDPLNSAEIWLLVLVGGNLVVTPWAFGGMVVWSQVLSLVLGVMALIVALRTVDTAGQNQSRRRLLRFPLFWLGLIYFAFVVTQILNPAWRYRVVGESWQLVGTPYTHWLPHGIGGTPYTMMNAWRVLMIHGAVWLTLCALWVGITRRKSARLLLALIAGNGAVVAMVFLLQRLTGTNHILWLWKPPADYFVAAFVYKNHAGVFLDLILAGCLGLAAWHSAHAQREMKKSHPGILFLFLALLVFVALLFTYARAATLCGIAIVIAAAFIAGGGLILRPVRAMPGSVLAVLVLLAVGFLGVCAISLNPENVWERFSRLLKEDEALSITARQIARHATVEMAQDSLWVGHGAGGFRFLFPRYQQRYPQIYEMGRGPTGPHFFWEHAHNDYAEGLAEYGLFGVVLGLTTVTCLFVALGRARIYHHPGLLAVLAGPAAVLVNAAVDFPFQNPAVLLTATGTVVLVTRWAQLEPKSRIIPAAVRD